MEKIKFRNEISNTVIVPDRFTLKGYMIEAIYANSPSNVLDAPCGGGHTCDRARFDILINNVVVLKANLNNLNDTTAIAPPVMRDGLGLDTEDRYSVDIISETLANQIADNDPLNYTINIVPNPNQYDPSDKTTHADITWVRIKDPQDNTIYSSCSAAGQAVSVTQAILESLGQIKRLECLDTVNLDFDIKNLTIGSEYTVKYRVLDIQSLTTIPQNESTYTFEQPCCTNKLRKEYQNGFDIIPSSQHTACTVKMNLRCTQSALIEISLIKNNTTISKDITQIICPTCKLDTSINQPIIEQTVLKNINDQFTINFTNLTSIGTSINQSFGNNADIPVIIENNDSYTEAPISLSANNLSLNSQYEYKFHILPDPNQINMSLYDTGLPASPMDGDHNNDGILNMDDIIKLVSEGSPFSVEPMSGRFFAGETQQTITSIFRMKNNLISIMYASLKDVETGITKISKLIYIVNRNNCAALPRKFELLDYPQNGAPRSALELGKDCNLDELLKTCIAPQ